MTNEQQPSSGKLITKLRKLWTNKWKILEGIWFNHIVFHFNKTHWALHEVEVRRQSCMSCPHLDSEGKGTNVFIKGKPACKLCGCNIMEKTACLSCDCSLAEQGAPPRWKALGLSADREAEVDQIL